MRVFSEVLGEFVEVPEGRIRVVSLAPSVTETLFYIGAGDMLAGVSSFCRKPPEAAKLPRVGGYLGVNYRLLHELAPDLVFTTTGVQRRLAHQLRERGFRVYPVPLPHAVTGIIDNVVLVGDVVGMHARAVERAMELLEVASSIARREILARVYYEVDLGEPVTVGAFSYISSSLRLIGLENVFAREPAAYMRPDFRRLAELEPDVIIYEARDESIAPGDVERMFRDRGLEELKAIREGRVIVLGPDSLAHYGPSHFKTLAELAKNVEDLVGRSP